MFCPAEVLLNTTLVSALTADANVAPLLLVSVRVLSDVVCPSVLVTLTAPALVAFKVNDCELTVLPLTAPLMFNVPPAVVSTTSSVSVNEHWQQYGPPDVVVIHRTFTTAAECRLYEHIYLKRVKAIYKEDWLNKSDSKAILTDNYSDSSWKNSHKSRRLHIDSDPKFKDYMAQKFIQNMHSETASKKRKETFILTKHSQGENNPRFGAKLTSETLTKISEARKKQYSLNKASADKLNQKNRSCEYCGKTDLTAGNYKRWHSVRCSSK